MQLTYIIVLLLPVAGILATPTAETLNTSEDKASWWPFPSFPSLQPPAQDAAGRAIKNTQCNSQYAADPASVYKIQSPLFDYNLNYPPSVSCNYEFLGTDGCDPVISCADFNIAKVDYLEVSDGLGASQRFNGTNAPRNVSSGISIMRVRFESAWSSSGKGFRCLISCASNTTEAAVNVIPNALKKPETLQCTCGVPGGEPQGTRIVGGMNSTREFWRWQTAMVLRGRRSPFCGGALINDRYVLTAAHCVVTTGLVAFPALAEVVFNEYDTTQTNETVTVRRTISRIIPHPFYDASTQDYDVALIEFYPPLNLTSTEEPQLTPVCLPPVGTKNLYAGENGTVTGWGTLTEGGEQATVLQEAVIPIITNADCNKSYNNRITPRMVCAAYPQGGIDSCQGDSGGPFMIQNGARYAEVGIVSFGEGCARQDKPGVYSRVTDLNDWIRQTSFRAMWCEE